MTHQEIVRAWKDPDYLQSLSPEQRQYVPGHPSGEIGEPTEYQPLYAVDTAGCWTMLSAPGCCPPPPPCDSTCSSCTASY
jgi:mersacidin/lichenicidin family type 2 lantibiotic